MNDKNVIFETERLLLRNWRGEDAKQLYELAKDPLVGPAAGWNPHQSVEESENIINTVFNFPTVYAIILKETGEIIGCIGFLFDENLCKDSSEALMGYWLGVDYWDKGYMTEAVNECIRYAFNDLKLTRIWCGNFKENTRSAHVQEKCGFKYHHTEKDNNWSDEVKEVIINSLTAITER